MYGHVYLRIRVLERESSAILYSGDVRAEPWFVNSIVRNPVIVPYTMGLKTLQNLYLDTSSLREGSLRSKAEGIVSLILFMEKYSADTIFYINAWTFG